MKDDVARTQDVDPEETRDWLDSISSVLDVEGGARAHFLIEQLVDRARRSGAYLPFRPNTAYINTIPVEHEPAYPGDLEIEDRVREYLLWNASIMVSRANHAHNAIGGHMASYASLSTLWEVGFNHFWRAPHDGVFGDLIYLQGHSSPGVYARSYLEGRFDDEQLFNFRREVEKRGLSSYPHPWLMRDYWQFPSVSMGLGPIMSIYQARFMRYMEHRGLMKPADRRVWAFVGDGEVDEPETLAATPLAVRENLDNLIWVVNCNLQRLDGPVRGNGKIVQELEAHFLANGWNVIKLLWGSRWDELFLRDKQGLLPRLMMETLDGDYQDINSKDGKFLREKFFGKYPELKELVANMSDTELGQLKYGGHDTRKVYAAYKAAYEHRGQPTVILAQTVKGFGLGRAAQGQNIAHNVKKLDEASTRALRDSLHMPVSDADLDTHPFVRPAADSPEMQYMQARRKALGGYLPQRGGNAAPHEVPGLDAFQKELEGTGDREVSTTMAMVRVLAVMLRDKTIGKYVVPIVPDETRSFGMEGLFRQIGIYSSVGQLYQPEDKDQLMYYKESKTGQLLEEGITEAGAASSFIAAGTAYSNYGVTMIPFFCFYSLFGWHRMMDLAWAAGDAQARGFMVGGIAGRTTLLGEGLQHQDGHGQIMAANIPNCIPYDPCYAYEIAVIVQDGLRRMFKEQEHVYFYFSVMNENYPQPAMPKGAEEGIRRGLYLLRPAKATAKLHVQLMGSGTILREVLAAAELLEKDWKVAADVWSATSFTLLRRDGQDCTRWNMLHPESKPRVPYLATQLDKHPGPVVAASDYVKLFADQIREFVPRRFAVLGTDGFGRSDTREDLRHFFEVDRYHVAVAALKALADDGELDAKKVSEAIKKYKLNPDKPNPLTV